MEAEAERVMAWVQDDCLTWTAQHKGKQCYQRSNVTVSLDGCQQGKGKASQKSSLFPTVFISPAAGKSQHLGAMT